MGSLPIFYTDSAKQSLQLVIDYIEENFGLKTADDFLNLAERKIQLISKNPFIYKASSIDENIRIATFTEQTSLFYQILEDKIVLLFFWDNRQDPLIERK